MIDDFIRAEMAEAHERLATLPKADANLLAEANRLFRALVGETR